MNMITEEYRISYEDERIGSYYVYNNGGSSYCVYADTAGIKELLQAGLGKSKDSKKRNPALTELIREGNRVPGTRKRIYRAGKLKAEWVPRDVEKFWIYRQSAEPGEPGFSEKKHSAPHYEGPHTPEGMREWASWYCFNKKDDGMYEAELDEAWWWGGGHNDGGTIRTEVPEEWLSLPYEEFLERVVTLSAATHYNFSAEDLEEKPGLKEFFGFA